MSAFVPLAVAAAGCVVLVAIVWVAKVRDMSRGMDCTIDALLDSDPDEDETGLSSGLDPDQVDALLGLPQDQVWLLLAPLVQATWPGHPVRDRRSARPSPCRLASTLDAHYDRIANEVIPDTAKPREERP